MQKLLHIAIYPSQQWGLKSGLRQQQGKSHCKERSFVCTFGEKNITFGEEAFSLELARFFWWSVEVTYGGASGAGGAGGAGGASGAGGV